LRVKRVQWAVGQGGFASGSIESEGQYFEYVYDCGSNNSGPLKDSISSLRPKGKKIDALFISHLDSDHVNGIEHLLVQYEIESVFLPYLDNRTQWMVAARSMSESDFTANVGELLTNPGGWFESRGVSNIFLIPPASPEEDYPEGMELGWPLKENDESSGFEEHRDDRRLQLYASENVPSNGQLDKEKANVTILSERASLGLRTREATWAFVPFVPPVSDAVLNEFYRSARSEGLEIDKGTDELAKILSDVGQRKKLKKAYRKISSNHNFVSMCLYSGPLYEQECWGRAYVNNHVLRWRKGPRWLIEEEVFLEREGKVGWLGTGDALLKNHDVLTAFQRRYDFVSQKVSTLMCPHHGSWHNYSDNLIELFDPFVVFAPASTTNGYGHPSIFQSINEPETRWHDHVAHAAFGV